MERYHVRVANDDLIFSAAHFITVSPGQCERLHGHNYRVAAEVHGRLGESHYVVDFIAVHSMLRSIVAELDHHVLLPTGHPSIRVRPNPEESNPEESSPEESSSEQPDPEQIEVTFGTRRWVFPPEDCRLLPIANTTTELLARLIAGRLLEGLQSRLRVRPEMVRIEVEESRGLWAVCELTEQ